MKFQIYHTDILISRKTPKKAMLFVCGSITALVGRLCQSRRRRRKKDDKVCFSVSEPCTQRYVCKCFCELPGGINQSAFIIVAPFSLFVCKLAVITSIHNSFRTTQQHFTLSSAQPLHFFTTLSHKALETHSKLCHGCSACDGKLQLRHVLASRYLK